MPTIQVADKPTLDTVNSNVTTVKNAVQNSTYGLQAIKNAIGGSTGYDTSQYFSQMTSVTMSPYDNPKSLANRLTLTASSPNKILLTGLSLVLNGYFSGTTSASIGTKHVVEIWIDGTQIGNLRMDTFKDPCIFTVYIGNKDGIVMPERKDSDSSYCISKVFQPVDSKSANLASNEQTVIPPILGWRNYTNQSPLPGYGDYVQHLNGSTLVNLRNPSSNVVEFYKDGLPINSSLIVKSSHTRLNDGYALSYLDFTIYAEYIMTE